MAAIRVGSLDEKGSDDSTDHSGANFPRVVQGCHVTEVVEVLAPHQELSRSLRQARYGVAYLRAVCAQAGVKLVETSPDEDVSGVDCLLSFPQFDTRVQVKCTARRLGSTTGTLSYHIGEKTFRKWARNQSRTYIVVVIVPENSDAWADFDVDDETPAHCAAYWAEVDRDRTAEPWTVQVERGRRLTPETLASWHSLEMEDTYGA